MNEFGSTQFEEISEVRATVVEEIPIMTKITGWLTAIVLASALALPANAASPNKGAGGGGGGGGQPAAKA
ncbi:MAG TPA: hypothetical protein VFC32_04880, partial [Pseudolabrys sp.]|nr:hypothetical protein [Pseudolabrys sp.]